VEEQFTKSLVILANRALIGEVYPEIRYIGLKCLDQKSIIIRFYFDRDVIEKDYQCATLVADKLAVAVLNEQHIKTVIQVECQFTNLSIGEISSLDINLVSLYARREWALEEVMP
jgi:hypothetical protein